MKETFTTLRNHYHNKLFALLFVVVAASLVGYVAWQSSVVVEQFITVEKNADQVPSATGLGRLYFSDMVLDTPNTLVTYKYDIKKNQQEVAFDYPYHSSFSPVNTQSAIVTIFDVDANEDASAAAVFKPAFIDFALDDLSYLDTPPGIAEQHYRVAPTQNAPVAYMQLTVGDESASDQSDIANWEVVIHQPATEQASATNTVISGAMYPEWLSDRSLAFLSAEGVVVYDLQKNQETLIDLPYTDYTIANQYLVGLANEEAPQLLLLASGENQFTVLTGQRDANDVLQTSIKYIVSEPDTIYVNAVLSPDQTMFAVLSLTTSSNSEAGPPNLVGELVLFSFDNPDPIKRLLVDLVDPENVTLLSWQ
jgi:hypothetical protein